MYWNTTDICMLTLYPAVLLTLFFYWQQFCVELLRGLWKLPNGRDWLRGKLGVVLMGRAILSKCLIWFSVDGWSYIPSLSFDLRPNYGGGNEVNDNLLQKVLCMHSYTQCPQPCSRPPPTHASAGDSWTLMGKSGSGSCRVIAPFSWVLVHTRFCVCPPKVLYSTKSLIFQELFVSTADLPWRRAWQPTPVTHWPGESP